MNPLATWLTLSNFRLLGVNFPDWVRDLLTRRFAALAAGAASESIALPRSDVLLLMLCAALAAALVFVAATAVVLVVIAVVLWWSFHRACASFREPRKRERIICEALTELDREAIADLTCHQEAA